MLLCGFGQFSDIADGCGNLYYARHGNGNGTTVMAFNRSCVGVGHYLIQPMAAETFILHGTATTTAPQSWRLIAPVWVLGHYMIQPMAAETFIPHVTATTTSF